MGQQESRFQRRHKHEEELDSVAPGVASNSLIKPKQSTNASPIPSSNNVEELEHLVVLPQLPKVRTTNNNTEEPLVPETVRKSEKLAKYSPICSKIEDNIFVSGAQVALSDETLMANGITHIINCANEAVPNAFESKYNYTSFNLRDGASEEISNLFPLVFNLISNTSDAVFLIHCQQGVSRSCTLAIAYLMWTLKKPYAEMFDYVKSKRSVCSPNSGFICQLLELEARITLGNSSVPRMYRFAPHSEFERKNVLKPCFVNGTRTYLALTDIFHSKGIFVIVTEAERVYCWIGSQTVLEEEFKNSITLLPIATQYYLNNNSITYVHEGADDDIPEEFTALFTAIDKEYCKKEYDSSATTSTTTIEKETKAADHNDNAIRLLLYKDNDIWEELENYDIDDLLPDSQYVLLTPDSSFLWIGSETASDLSSIVQQKALEEFTCEVAVEHDGSESAEFWDAFESGY